MDVSGLILGESTGSDLKVGVITADAQALLIGRVEPIVHQSRGHCQKKSESLMFDDGVKDCVEGEDEE